MDNKKIYKYLPVLLIAFFCSCSIAPYYNGKYKGWKTSLPSDSAQLKYTVFLIGDAGQPDKGLEPTFKLLRSQLYSKIDTIKTNDGTRINYESDPNNTVVFLGDNIYYRGLPKESANDRGEMERRIIAQMDIVKPFKGKKYFIPGNHDWGGEDGNPDGLEAIIREEKFIEQYMAQGDVFLPSNGCPGPVEVNIHPDLTLIIVDSQWWLHKFRKPLGPENGCNVEDKLDFAVQLDDIVKRNKGKHIMICEHHPLYTNGNHGGFYTLKDYLFPLTLKRPNLYIPLPIIGAIYPLARKYGLSPQDLANPEYQQLKKALLDAVDNEYSVIFAAGHEHSLQMFKKDGFNHIISGAGCKATHVARGNDAIFAHNHKGFARINYYTNGTAWVEFWEPEGDGSKGKLAFRAPLYGLHPEKKKELPADFECKDSTIVLAASKEYKASGFKKLFFGDHYRQEWGTPIKIHLLDMKCAAGGLTPLKKGGGQQTASLRLIGGDSLQYTLRTINKDPSSLLPKGLRETFAEDFLQDQMSSAHPYGALIIPGLANAIRIYHLKPQLFYVPFTPGLGQYLDEMGGKMAFLEVRPDEDLGCFKDLGCTKAITSTRTMYSFLNDDNSNDVDERMFLRARLFDMLIGDWDRHEDQWRWAEFPNDKGGLLFKPIPRDRDQVFVKYDGIFPFLISSYLVKNFSSFRANFGKVVKLGVSAQNLDHTLLTKLTREDWKIVADSIKLMITDSVIEHAVRDLPPEIFAISGQEIINKLKSRKAQLSKAADEYYSILARTVDITGSDKDDFFKISRVNNNDTRIEIYSLTDQRKPGFKFFDRTFHINETREIRVHALQGNDSMLITGNVEKGIKIRAAGGMGYDAIIDQSSVKGRSRKTVIYDTYKEKNNIVKSSESKIKESSRYYITQYDVQDFKYNQIAPDLSAEFNVDDGLFLGGGIKMERHGFRNDPYKSFNSLVANYAFLTKAFNIKYQGTFYSLFAPKWDLSVISNYYGPKFVINYYGKGNESILPSDAESREDFYRLRIQRFEFTPYIQHRLSNYFSVGIGPNFEYMDVAKGLGKVVDDPLFPNQEDLKPTYFGGAKFFSAVNLVDNNKSPTRGGRWRNEINYYHELKGGTTEFTKLSTDLSFYITPNTDWHITIALRAGGAKNIGSYKFYQSNFLGGTTNLRGFKRTRFAGNSSAYGNAEARLRLSRFRNVAFTGTIGLLGFTDIGRVWGDNDTSLKWHAGYGPGLWMNLYNQVLISGYYGFSEEGGHTTVKLGYFF